MKTGLISDFLRKLGVRKTVGSDDLSEMAAALVSSRGEASGMAVADQMLTAYGMASAPVRLEFLTHLAENFGPDPALLGKRIAAYQASPSAAAAQNLHIAAESRRQELIRRMNLAPNAMERLVRMREDVLQNLKAVPKLEIVDADFTHLFSSWFNRGFLHLRRIDWSTPAHILEKIITYEAVHAITSWDDLRLRLLPADRRCFAFFHPALADEPLIFVEVALTTEIPSAIGPLLAEKRQTVDPDKVTTAVFYSISNCQAGLRGVSFGNFLIKQVVEELKRELPRIKTFVTLSPVPGLMRWLQPEKPAKGISLISDEDRKSLKALATPGWEEDEQQLKLLRPALNRAALAYLIDARDPGGKPVDAVARFHLGNGARLERINWLGDISPKGMKQAAGFMVNYLYDLDSIERNHEAFANQGEIVLSQSLRRTHAAARKLVQAQGATQWEAQTGAPSPAQTAARKNTKA